MPWRWNPPFPRYCFPWYQPVWTWNWNRNRNRTLISLVSILLLVLGTSIAIAITITITITDFPLFFLLLCLRRIRAHVLPRASNQVPERGVVAGGPGGAVEVLVADLGAEVEGARGRRGARPLRPLPRVQVLQQLGLAPRPQRVAVGVPQRHPLLVPPLQHRPAAPRRDPQLRELLAQLRLLEHRVVDSREPLGAFGFGVRVGVGWLRSWMGLWI